MPIDEILLLQSESVHFFRQQKNNMNQQTFQVTSNLLNQFIFLYFTPEFVCYCRKMAIFMRRLHNSNTYPCNTVNSAYKVICRIAICQYYVKIIHSQCLNRNLYTNPRQHSRCRARQEVIKEEQHPIHFFFTKSKLSSTLDEFVSNHIRTNFDISYSFS